MRHDAWLVSLTLALVFSGLRDLGAQTTPNIVVFFVDHLGWGDPACFGGRLAPTPGIDRLAAEGLKATDFYVAQPVCSASRAALLTGRYPHRVGISGALSPDRALFFYYDDARLQAVRAGDLKLHVPHSFRSMEGRTPGADGRPGDDDYGRRTGVELYDLRKDVGERTNLAGERPDDVAALQALIDAQLLADRRAASRNEPWIDATWYASRLADWRRHGDEFRCVESRLPFRTLHKLTRRLPDIAALGRDANAALSVVIAPARAGGRVDVGAAAGLLIGIGGAEVDYRTSALVAQAPGIDGGIAVLVDDSGRVRIKDFAAPRSGATRWVLPEDATLERLTDLGAVESSGTGMGGPWTDATPITLRLRLNAESTIDEPPTWRLVAEAWHGDRLLSRATASGLAGKVVDGGIALLSHGGPAGGLSFRSFATSGAFEGDDATSDRRFGPIFGSLYTLDRRADGKTGLRMTAHVPPLHPLRFGTLGLDVAAADVSGTWREIARGTYDPNAAIVHFAADGLDVSRPLPYRVRVELLDAAGAVAEVATAPSCCSPALAPCMSPATSIWAQSCAMPCRKTWPDRGP